MSRICHPTMSAPNRRSVLRPTHRGIDLRRLAYPPGQPTVRRWRWDAYRPHQEEIWQTLDDTYHALVYGFGHTRLPGPGATLNPDAFLLWRKKFISAWDNESSRKVGTVGPPLEDFSMEHLLHVYERMSREV